MKSNAIVYAKDLATVGIGAGQMSRVDSTRIAAHKALEAAQKEGSDVPLTKGSVVASDAFFPFPDGLITAAEAGATAVIQPGGSIRDEDVIAAADERGLDRYYGLLELGELGGLWKNVAGRYEIDGKKVYAKAIYKDPESYFTPEVMEKLDEIAKEEFSYGS